MKSQQTSLLNPTYLRSVFLFGLCLVFAAQGLDAATSTPVTAPADQVTLQLKWYHQFQFAGYYAAVEKGFYREEGLDVVLIEGNPGQPPLASVLDKKAIYGVSDSDLLVARLQGKPLVVLAAIFQHTPYIIMTRLDRGIHHPRDLIGRKVMLDSDQGGPLTKAMFLNQGVDFAKVQRYPHTWKIRDLIDGKVDAMSSYYNTEPAQMQAMGVKPGIMRLMDYGVDFYGDTLFTTESEILEHPDRAAAFRRASLKGWRYAFDHTEEIIQMILQLPGVQQRGITAELLRYEADMMQQLVLPNVVDIGSMSTERWQRMANTYTSLGITTSTRNLDGFVYTPETSTHLHLLKWVTIGCIGLFLISIVVFIWMFQMKQLVKRRTRELALQNEQLTRQSEALALSEASYRQLFNIAHDAIFVHDVDTFQTLDVNSRACELFGYAREELISGTPEKLSCGDPDRIRKNLLEVKRRSASEGALLFEWHCRHRSGHEFWCEIDIKRGTVNGEDRLIALVRDITERKRIEEERLKISKLDALGILAGGIAHDLNNIMLGIILNVDLLLNRASLDRDETSLVRSAKNAALRASDLSRRLLTFAKGGDPVKKMVNIREIITNSINLSLRGSKLLGNVTVDPNLPPVLADPGQLSQVLDNLVINAREASPRGGNLFVRCQKVHHSATEISTIPEGDYLRIEVEDQGCGIPSEILDKIFDPYFTTKKTGHGIGLATSYSIMKKHGGDILVRSEVGHGTTFTLLLPIHTSDVAAAPSATPSMKHPAVPRPERLLIIDDDTLIRKTLVLLLHTLGYAHVESVETGEAGLTAYRDAIQNSTPFDLVILDGTIPGHLGGEEAFKALRHIDPKARVILSSGYSDSSAATHWKELGFCAILPKPFAMHELDALLSSLPGTEDS